MANKESDRVMRKRKVAYDRVSVLTEKDGKYLLHAQALREGVSVAEMIRRAILARCGLRAMPDTGSDLYQRVIESKSADDARTAIRALQFSEFVSPPEKESPADSVYYTLYLTSEVMRDEYIKVLLDLLDIVESANLDGEQRIELDKKRMTDIRRLLANIEEIREYPD